MMGVMVAGSDETFEERMRLVRFAAEFRMELAGNEKWMVLQFDHLDQIPSGEVPLNTNPFCSNCSR